MVRLQELPIWTSNVEEVEEVLCPGDLHEPLRMPLSSVPSKFESLAWLLHKDVVFVHGDDGDTRLPMLGLTVEGLPTCWPSVMIPLSQGGGLGPGDENSG